MVLHGTSFVVGRGEQCDVQLESQSVSRAHCTLSPREDGITVTDTSTNGTVVEGTLLRSAQSARVPYGAPIRMGDHEVIAELNALLEVAQHPASAPPTEKATIRLDEAPQFDDSALRREMHKDLLEELDLAQLDKKQIDDPSFRASVIRALRAIVERKAEELPGEAVSQDTLVGELAAEALGLGPLDALLRDPDVSEIMVVDPATIYIERKGKLELASSRFTDDERARAALERIVTPLGRRIDESSPLVDARLKDGSRVNAVIRPVALRGTCITIRKFASKPLQIDDLLRFGALSDQMARFLTRSVIARKNIVISGGTGSGKTTLLNVLSASIPEEQRIVTIEDAAELQLVQPHVVSLETKPANMEGKGGYSMRDLLRNAMRMRPDRVIVGECRGGEALDMLQAMNTGHDGSLTTTHANAPKEAVSRLETLVLMGGLDLPISAVRRQIASSVNLIVQQSRLSDGSRRVTSISEVTGIDERGEVSVLPIFEFVRSGTGPDGSVLGDYRATGYMPSYIAEFVLKGLVEQGAPVL
jgi:pilus assembly protein CpaF